MDLKKVLYLEELGLQKIKMKIVLNQQIYIYITIEKELIN